MKCTPIPHDPTMLEMLGIGEESTCDQYCQAVDDFVHNRITESECVALMAARKVIKR